MPGLDHELAERQPVAQGLRGGPAVGVDQAGHADRFLAGGVGRAGTALPSIRSPSRASKAMRVPVAKWAVSTTVGSEWVSWRGLAPSAAASGTGSSHRSSGARSLRPMARMADASGSQPTAIHTPSNGLTTAVRAAGRRSRGARRRRQLADQQVDEPVADLHAGEALAVGRWQRRVSPAAAGLAVLAAGPS